MWFTSTSTSVDEDDDSRQIKGGLLFMHKTVWLCMADNWSLFIDRFGHVSKTCFYRNRSVEELGRPSSLSTEVSPVAPAVRHHLKVAGWLPVSEANEGTWKASLIILLTLLILLSLQQVKHLACSKWQRTQEQQTVQLVKTKRGVNLCSANFMLHNRNCKWSQLCKHLLVQCATRGTCKRSHPVVPIAPRHLL